MRLNMSPSTDSKQPMNGLLSKSQIECQRFVSHFCFLLQKFVITKNRYNLFNSFKTHVMLSLDGQNRQKRLKVMTEKKLKDVDQSSKCLRTKTINVKKFKHEKHSFPFLYTSFFSLSHFPHFSHLPMPALSSTFCQHALLSLNTKVQDLSSYCMLAFVMFRLKSKKYFFANSNAITSFNVEYKKDCSFVGKQNVREENMIFSHIYKKITKTYNFPHYIHKYTYLLFIV